MRSSSSNYQSILYQPSLLYSIKIFQWCLQNFNSCAYQNLHYFAVYMLWWYLIIGNTEITIIVTLRNLIIKSTALKHVPRNKKTRTFPNPLLVEFQKDQQYPINCQNKFKMLKQWEINSEYYLSKIKIKLDPRSAKRQAKQ